MFLFFFFFQAEDGIRDHCVTGVQTCALPICGIAIAAGLFTRFFAAAVTIEMAVITFVHYWSNGFSWLNRRSEEHTSELQSHSDLVCRLLLEKKKKNNKIYR